MKEKDIRPSHLLDEYLRLSKIDAEKFFSDKESFSQISCPACGSKNSSLFIEKHGFNYDMCNICNSIFLSPRPSEKAFTSFYKNSPSSNYWAETFFPSVAEARRELIFKSRVENISHYCMENNINHRNVMDVGAGHGIFLEEWKKIHKEDNIYALEPGEKSANICRSKNIETLEKFSENAQEWHSKADLVTCFEVIEHVYSPLEFIKSLKMLTKKKGQVLISGLSGDGFDIQLLKKDSNSVSPPHHLNFISIDGFDTMFKEAGYDNINIITPGRLDFDIVKNSMNSNNEIFKNNAFANLISKRGEEAEKDFQKFLQKHKLSSHVWIYARHAH